MRQAVCREVQVLRLKMCNNKEKTNMCIASRSNDPVTQGMIAALLATTVDVGGGEIRYGLAPPTHMESELQKLLNRLVDDE